MPLFRTSLLALLLLPLSLSCDSNRPLEDIRNDYSPIVETELNNTKRQITSLLNNTSCKERQHKHRLPSCSSDITNVVRTLHNLTCKMKNLGVSHTDRLARSLLASIRCFCLDKPTKQPRVKSRRRRTTRSRRNEQRKFPKEMKKLCKAVDILSNMTECYQILNTQLVNN